MRFSPTASLLALAGSVQAAADTVQAFWPAPVADRWMYPFNSTPGTRATMSVFGSDVEVPTQFDARDGQVLLAFDTLDQVTGGDEALSLNVLEAEVTLQVQNGQVFRHDPTSDAWTDFLPSTDPRRTVDADAGQPVELAAVGFRNGWTAETFQETSPFSSAPGSLLAPSVRNAFAAEVDAQGVTSDISNHPRVGFQPQVFAVGRVDGLAAGALVPQDSTMRFRLDVSRPGTLAYLRRGLRQGRLWFSVSSLTLVQQQTGAFPSFYARENSLVTLGFAQAATLRLKVQTAPACAKGDIDCSGAIDAGDIGAVLLSFGPCPEAGTGCTGDLDDSGAVDAGDIGWLLLNFS